MNWLRKIMIGRYGVDQLSMALMGASILFSILSIFIKSPIITILYMITLILAFYRVFSKNISKRYQENNKFLRIWNTIKNKINYVPQRIKSLKDYRYFKCSNCKQTLRVPRGKGKLSITCPKCKNVMIKKS